MLSISETMWVTWGCLRYSTLSLLVISAATGYNAATYFTANWKPLQCHEIKSIEVRSTIDCCLYCMKNVYSCAGYMLDRNGNSELQCDVCYIYGVTTPLDTIQHMNNRVSGMPAINKKSGTRVVEKWKATMEQIRWRIAIYVKHVC